jgi:hypothetical protein
VTGSYGRIEKFCENMSMIKGVIVTSHFCSTRERRGDANTDSA